jgi:hypothetical protein
MRPRILPYGIALLLIPATATTLLAQANNEEYIRTAVQGAPERISDQAAVVRIEPGGKTSTLRKGANGFTCALFPDASLAPICADEQGWRWFVAAVSNQPKPPNTQPGIAYMAKGGVHYEMPDGKIVMAASPQTKEVQEPPHWMVLWPLDPAKTGLPTRPNAGGTYLMFEGTPFSHVMIYQDPKMLEKK